MSLDQRWFVFRASRGLTENYHSGGGAVVRGTSLAEATVKLKEAVTGRSDAPLIIEECEGLDAGDDVVIFPDAGCC